MPSPILNQKLITTKFLGKCLFGGHPWIRLAMDCERNGGKEITAYDVSRMENNGNSRLFLLTGKPCSSKYVIPLISALSSGTFDKSMLPSVKGLSIYFYAIFIFT
jgi:hypothetical protein